MQQKRARYDHHHGHRAFEATTRAADMGEWTFEDIFLALWGFHLATAAAVIWQLLWRRWRRLSVKRVAKGSSLRVKCGANAGGNGFRGWKRKLRFSAWSLPKAPAYDTCSACNGQGSVMRVTTTILGQMRTTRRTCAVILQWFRKSRQ